MVDNSHVETMFPDGVDCLQSLEMDTGLSRQISYNDSIHSTPWPKLYIYITKIEIDSRIARNCTYLLLYLKLYNKNEK